MMNTSIRFTRSVQAKPVVEFLTGLGLTHEESLIYQTLVESGILTTLELARKTGINRTRVYRLLEKLKQQGFVEEVIDQHRKMAKAVSADILDLMVKDQEIKAKQLRETFPTISALISGATTAIQPGTKVLFYRGKEGIRQQVWNTLRTKKEGIGYSYRPLVELIGDYYYKWRDEWIKRKLQFRDIYSDEYLSAKKPESTDSLSSPIVNFESRYISAKILNINHQIDIYNDVVSYYNWHEGEIFGVEIYNQKVADMQKQLFEIVWKMTGKL